MQTGPIVVESLSAFIKTHYPLLSPIRRATPEELAAIKEYLTPSQRKNTPNSFDELLRTPCHLAVIHCQPQILELFVLEAYGSLNNHDSLGKQPGDYATNDEMRLVVSALQKESARRKAYEKLNRGGRDLGYLLERNKQGDEILIGMIRNFLLIRKEEVYLSCYYAGSNLAHIAAWSNVSEKVLNFLAKGCTNNGCFIDFNAQNDYGLRPIDYALASKKAYFERLVSEQRTLLNRDHNIATHQEMFNPSRTTLVPPPLEEDSSEPSLIEKMVQKLNLGTQTVASRGKNAESFVSLRMAPHTARQSVVPAAAIFPSLSTESVVPSSSKEKSPLMHASPEGSPPRATSPLSASEVVSPRLKLAPLGERARKPQEPVEIEPAKSSSKEDVASPRKERGFSLLGTLKTGTLKLAQPFTLTPAESPASALSSLPVVMLPNRSPVFSDVNVPTYQLIDKDNLEGFIAKKRNPNGKSSSINHPYFLQAFISSAQRIFIWLAENGLYLDKDHAWLKILEYTKEGHTPLRVSFLNSVIKTLSAKVSVAKINEARLALSTANEQFDLLLVEHGLTKLTPLPSKPKFNENTLEEILYEICSGFNFETKEYKFNAAATQNLIYGLLAEFSPEEIIDTLMVLHRFLGREQKLFAFYIIKTILVFDNIHHCYQNDSFCEQNLASFLKLMAQSHFEALNAKLLEILALRKKAATPILTTINLLQAIIARCKVKKLPFNEEPPRMRKVTSREEVLKTKKPFLEDPMLFANELRAISLQFYQTVSLTEFKRLAFSKANKEQLSPNIVHQIEITNKLSYYLIKTVLEKPNELERHKYLVFLINTLYELLHGEIKDFNSAMSLSGALEDAFLSKFMRDLLQSNREVLEKWTKCCELLSPLNNFKNLRGAMTTGIPFLGIFTRDLTFTQDKNSLTEKCSTLASLFSNFSAFQEKLFEIKLNVQTDLLYTLDHMLPRNDDLLEMLAFTAAPCAIRFDFNISFEKLIHMLNTFTNKNMPLSVKIYLNEEWKELSEKEALPHLMAWLQSNITSHPDVLSNISMIFSILRKMPSLKEVIEKAQMDFEIYNAALFATQSPPPLLLSPRQAGTTSEIRVDLLNKGKSPKPV